jgi:hypothetical protein
MTVKIKNKIKIHKRKIKYPKRKIKYPKKLTKRTKQKFKKLATIVLFSSIETMTIDGKTRKLCFIGQ